jgi:hypothetical protein
MNKDVAELPLTLGLGDGLAFYNVQPGTSAD